MKIFFICLILSFLIWVPLIGIYLEKKSYNRGICIECGKKLRLFDHDSHGGRGYCCDNCCYHTWVSYNCVDKDYQEDDENV